VSLPFVFCCDVDCNVDVADDGAAGAGAGADADADEESAMVMTLSMWASGSLTDVGQWECHCH